MYGPTVFGSEEDGGKVTVFYHGIPVSTELLPELTLAQLMEITPAEIARNVHAHPTLSEVLLEIAEDAAGHAIHQ